MCTNYSLTVNDQAWTKNYVSEVFADLFSLWETKSFRGLLGTLYLSVKSHLTSGASVCRENPATYSVGKKFVAFSGQKICGIFSETAPLSRSSTPSLEWPYIRSAIFPADNMHAHCAFERRSVMQHGLHDAISSPCVLYSFTMIILGLEILVYPAGYRLALSMSKTVVLLYSSLSRIEGILNTRVVY